MNLFGRMVGYVIKGWYDALQTYAGSASEPALILPVYEGGEPVGTETMSEAESRRLALVSAWASSAINEIAGRVSAAVPDITVRIGDEELDDHEALSLIRSPNGLVSGAWFARYIIFWYELRGNAYAIISSTGLGQGIDEVLPIPSYMMRPIPESVRRADDGSLVVDYYYSSPDGLVRIPGEYVLHWRTPNPEDYWQGLSPLSAAMNGLRTDYSQARWVDSFFSKDNAIPAGIVSVPPTITPQLFEAVKRQFREEFGGKRRTAIVRGGDLTVETIQQTLEQMQIVQSRDFSRREIDRAFGIPEGLLDGALSGDSREAVNRTFARDTVQPILNHYVEVWASRLRLFYPDIDDLVAPNIVPQDRMLRVQEYRTYALDRTINENREVLGLEPLDLPVADVPVRVLSLMMKQASQGLAPSGFGLQNPDAMTEAQAGKDDGDGALYEAWAAEIDRWRRMTLSGWRKGNKDAWQEFRHRYLPETMVSWAQEQLAEAKDIDDVKGVFSAMSRVTGRVIYRRNGNRGWSDNLRAAARLFDGG